MCSQQTLAKDQQSEKQLWSQGEAAGLWVGTPLNTRRKYLDNFSAASQQLEQYLEHGSTQSVFAKVCTQT